MMQPNEYVSLFYSFNFYFFGLVALASAIAFVTRKSAVAAAMWLVSVMCSLAALYVMLDAQFIGVMQVLVYTGAIMVVFLFVIMLLNLGSTEGISDASGRWGSLGALFIGLALLAEVLAFTRYDTVERLIPADLAARIAEAAAHPLPGGVIGPIAESLFNEYLLAFELTSVLLLAAILGAVVLGKRRTDAR